MCRRSGSMPKTRPCPTTRTSGRRTARPRPPFRRPAEGPPADATRRLKEMLPKIANVIAEPKPDVEIITFNERGPVLAVRPYCNTAHYWQVYFDTNRTIRETFGAAGYPAAEAHLYVRQKSA